MTALAGSQGADKLGDAVALTDGYSAAFLGAAGIAAVGGLLALVTLRRGSVDATDSEADEAEKELVAA